MLEYATGRRLSPPAARPAAAHGGARAANDEECCAGGCLSHRGTDPGGDPVRAPGAAGTQSAMRLCLRRGGQSAHARRPRGQTAARESGRPADVARVTLGRRDNEAQHQQDLTTQSAPTLPAISLNPRAVRSPAGRPRSAPEAWPTRLMERRGSDRRWSRIRSPYQQ